MIEIGAPAPAEACSIALHPLADNGLDTDRAVRFAFSPPEQFGPDERDGSLCYFNFKRQPASTSSKPPARLRLEIVKAASNQNFSGNNRMSVSEVLNDHVPGVKKTW